MFFILSKIVIIFLYPSTWCILCLAGFFFIKNNKWKKTFKILAISFFLFFSNTSIFLEFMKKWEIHGTKIKDVKQYEVGIVLGGMFDYNNDLEVLTVRSHADRIWQAITLYKKGKIKKIFISGGSGYGVLEESFGPGMTCTFHVMAHRWSWTVFHSVKWRL